MIAPFSYYKIRRLVIEHWSLLVSFIVFLLLLFVVLVFFGRYNSQKKDVDLMSGEVLMLKNRYDTLKFNKTLTQDQIKGYNKLLASLIPETEDFFSIIYAIEEISNATQFMITEYAIDIGRAPKETIILTASGKGNSEAFLEFLKQYKFVGGRLVTIDQIQYGGINSGDTKITLNFYNKRFAYSETVKVPQLSKAEIQKLEDIKQRVKFQFSASDYQSVDTDYAVKQNPFTKEGN